MSKAFNKTFFGYKKSQVEEKINLLEKEFNKEKDTLIKEEQILSDENLRLKSEIEEVKKRLSVYRKAENDVRDILYNVFLENTSKVYDMNKKYTQMTEYKKNLLKMLQDKSEFQE